MSKDERLKVGSRDGAFGARAALRWQQKELEPGRGVACERRVVGVAGLVVVGPPLVGQGAGVAGARGVEERLGEARRRRLVSSTGEG
eukprot:scaffold24652_cov101-Isochrysis_galbana.AAC.4